MKYRFIVSAPIKLIVSNILVSKHQQITIGLCDIKFKNNNMPSDQNSLTKYISKRLIKKHVHSNFSNQHKINLI